MNSPDYFEDAVSKLYFQWRDRMPGCIRIAIRPPEPPLSEHHFVVVAMFNEDNGRVAMRLLDPTYRGWTMNMIIENAANEMGVTCETSFGAWLGSRAKIKWNEVKSLALGLAVW